MTANGTRGFLAGVIEGFYGLPWSPCERLELFDWMAAWGLDTYLYAPKDDLKHRVLWREPYSAPEFETLAALIRACQERRIRFIYALSPGLDIRYGHEGDLGHLQRRFEQMLRAGCRDFALLFDDIPGSLSPEEMQRWGSLARAQCHVTNRMLRWTRERAPEGRFLFCPTAYCGRMAQRRHGGQDYLATVGRELLPEIDVFWTGPEIISREITLSHVEEVGAVLRRKPLVWDNLHANDYDGRRFFCGPYAGRAPELRPAVSGLLSNPNCEMPLNFVPLRTLAGFVRCDGAWDARQAYLSAMQEWHLRFVSVRQAVSVEDLVLFGDCYYLPYQEGPEAEALCADLRTLLVTEPAEWGGAAGAFRQAARRLRDFCVCMAELRDRSLFHALSRRLWELREEMDLLLDYVEYKSRCARCDVSSYRSDFHLPGTYRGGMVARLQRMLSQLADGSFAPAVEKLAPCGAKQL
jgi:protein O-GlcNAcase/histone acetyltransferase